MTTISQLSITANAAGHALNVRSADLTLDAGRAPYARLRLTVPYTPATAAYLDPRTGVRITGTMRQEYHRSQTLAAISATFTGQTLAAITTAYNGHSINSLTFDYGPPYRGTVERFPQELPFDLGLRSREVHVEDGELVLTATSDESKLTDYALLAATPFSPEFLTIESALVLVFGTALYGQGIDTSSVYGAPINATAALWQPGESAWSYITSLLTPYEFRLWCDERAVWHVGPVDEFIISAAYDMADTTNLKGVQDATDRDLQWYDGVIVIYTWTDASNVRHVQYDIAFAVPKPSKILTVNVDRPYPGAGEAAARLGKVYTRGHQLRLDVSPDLKPRPSQFIGVAVTGEPALAGYTESITWSVPTDAMSVTAYDIHEV